jgi:hypothetical protein
MKVLVSVITLTVCAAALFVAGWIVPWTINVFGATLWPTHPIPYTWETALAGVVILVVFTPRVTLNKKD